MRAVVARVQRLQRASARANDIEGVPPGFGYKQEGSTVQERVGSTQENLFKSLL